MMRTLVILVAFLGLATIGATDQDATLTPGGSGSQLVESVCDRIQAACIFDDDKLLLRRVAYVESQDGHDPDTYRDGYDGGIWQVDQSFFSVTKSTEAAYELYPYFEQIRHKLSIDWQTVTWQDCRKPLISALAARLYMQYTSRHNSNGIPRDIDSQADYWLTYYRTSGNRQHFIDKANALETGCESSSGADIVFVLDGSGSIGYSHFRDIKEFAKDVVRAFQIGSYQIGVIKFSSRVYTEFNLNTYSTQDDIINAIDDIDYYGGGTYTHLALEKLIDEAFLPSNGGRGASIPKVGIILTDGQSSSSTLTISEAERAHRAGIIMIAIGVGSSIDQTELEAIASEPKCLHLFLLSGFNEIDDLKYAIEKRTCDAPIVVQPGNNGTDTGGRIPPGDNINCQIKIPRAGATISLSTRSGTHSTLFLADDTYPSSVYYQERLDSTISTPAVRYIRNPHASALNDEWLIFCNIIGTNNTETNFTFGIRPGDTTSCQSDPCLYGVCVDLVDGFRCDCFEGYTGRLCDSEIPNPCEPNPCQNGGSCTPNGDTDFTCSCPAGYTGDRCQEVVNPCDSNPCVYGTCVQDGNNFVCQCFDGYTGRLCDSEIPNPCEPNPCQNGGTCSAKSDTEFSCTCPPGYTGDTCGQIVNPCDSNPCVYGTRVQDGNNFVCQCFDGYTGRLCDSEIPNPCEPNPCQNGGTCSAKSDTEFSCTCPPGYTGDTCGQIVTTTTTTAPYGYDCDANNPCTPENIEQGNFYFPHHDPEKFVQCDAHGGCFVMPCAPGTVWDPDLTTCNFAP